MRSRPGTRRELQIVARAADMNPFRIHGVVSRPEFTDREREVGRIRWVLARVLDSIEGICEEREISLGLVRRTYCAPWRRALKRLRQRIR